MPYKQTTTQNTLCQSNHPEHLSNN